MWESCKKDFFLPTMFFISPVVKPVPIMTALRHAREANIDTNFGKRTAKEGGGAFSLDIMSLSFIAICPISSADAVLLLLLLLLLVLLVSRIILSFFNNNFDT